MITFDFIVSRLIGDNGIELSTSLNVSVVKGLELIMPSTSTRSVLKFSSFKLSPCVRSSEDSIVRTVRI